MNTQRQTFRAMLRWIWRNQVPVDGSFVPTQPDSSDALAGRKSTVEAGWLTLIMLFPLCRWFSSVKQRRRDWWLSYL